MMYCSNCGAKIADNAKFCAECGNKVNGDIDNTSDPIEAKIQQRRHDNTDSSPIMVSEGTNGSLELFDKKIRIKRSKGFNSLLLQGMKGDKDIYIKQISSIQIKKPGI